MSALRGLSHEDLTKLQSIVQEHYYPQGEAKFCPNPTQRVRLLLWLKHACDAAKAAKPSLTERSLSNGQ